MNPRGYVTTTLYDRLHRPDRVIDPLGNVTTTTYDPLLQALNAFLSGAILAPEAIGELIGRVYFQILLTVVQTVIAALLSEGTAAPAVVALQTTKLGKSVRAIRTSQKLAPGLQNAQGAEWTHGAMSGSPTSTNGSTSLRLSAILDSRISSRWLLS
jgi:hypothetical protein